MNASRNSADESFKWRCRPGALARNVSNVLEVLDKNRYENSTSARLIAVTKTVTPEIINLLKPLKILDIGENRAQVAIPKLTKIAPDFRLHWIGRLQSNKVKYIINYVCMLHTMDRLSLAQEVNRRAGENRRILPTLIQVNIAKEPQKGSMAPEEFAVSSSDQGFSAATCGRLNEYYAPRRASQEELRTFFRGMRQLFDQLRTEAVAGVEMRELSMGMSNDYAIAASEGATMVRVGTALYRK